MRITEAIKLSVDEMVMNWNKEKLPKFFELFEMDFCDYFKNRQTAEKTKIVSPILSNMFGRIMGENLHGFRLNDDRGSDFLYEDTSYELKITFGQGKGWTGNGYWKEPKHILLKFAMDETGIITKKFAMLVDLNVCVAKWTEPELSSNFSTLEFPKEDFGNLCVIIGDLKINPKKLAPVMEQVIQIPPLPEFEN